MAGWTITEARPEDVEAALLLLFAHSNRAEREHLVTRARRFLTTGELSAAGLLVGRRADEVLAAMLAAPAPGHVGLIWPPQAVRMRERAALEDALVQHTLTWLGEQGVKLCQALLRPDQIGLAKPLLRNGFRHITSLSFLRKRLNPEPSRPAATGELEFGSYSAATHQIFADTLLRSYEGSLDCPELNGVRTIEETLAGHQAQGRFEPGRWWLVLECERPIGVLLLNATADEHAWDLIYMGLIPAARGRGLGRQVLAKALHEARQAQVSKLTVSVDRRNQRALNLYRRAGFEVVERREVILAILPLTSVP